jgi:hypothetical protein
MHTTHNEKRSKWLDKNKELVRNYGKTYRDVRSLIKRWRTSKDLQALLELTVIAKQQMRFCRITNTPIVYHQTSCKIDKHNQIVFTNISHNTTMSTGLGHRKEITVSYDGMLRQFGAEFADVFTKQPNLFSRINKYTIFAFDLTDEEIKRRNKQQGHSLEKFILAYGVDVGQEKWSVYRKKRSNAVKNLTYLLKFSQERLDKINAARNRTLAYYVNKFGDTDGLSKFTKANSFSKVSKVSIKCFDAFTSLLYTANIVDDFLTNTDELSIFDSQQNKFLYYDFCSKKYKIIVEFHGDIFHGNPDVYSAEQSPDPRRAELTAKDMWLRDARKQLVAENAGYAYFVIWEKSFVFNREETFRQLLNSIQTYIRTTL